MYRAKNSGIRLTEQDAAIIKGMLARGDRQSDIAAYFKVNGVSPKSTPAGRSQRRQWQPNCRRQDRTILSRYDSLQAGAAE